MYVSQQGHKLPTAGCSVLAVGEMLKVKCGVKTAEWCCGMVGKIHNAEICVCDDRTSTGGV